jgi:hypothetical protein
MLADWPAFVCLGFGLTIVFFATVFEAVAFAVHLENVDVVGQTMQQRTS